MLRFEIFFSTKCLGRVASRNILKRITKVLIAFKSWIGLNWGIKANYPHVMPGPIGRVPSVRVFLRDPNPYLCEFRWKPKKTLNGLVDVRDKGLNPAPPVYQF